MDQSTRPCGKLGTWYPEGERLTRMLAAHYKPQPEPLKFVIAPHAGLDYCVESQGAVFSRVDLKQYELILILGVCHAFHLRGLGQTSFTAWQDPLGGQDLVVSRLEKFSTVGEDGDAEEHSAEILTPYLSYLMKQQGVRPKIAVIYCGTDPSDEEVKRLQQLVASQKVLIVVSSDFCHFGRRFDYVPRIEGKTAQETVDYVNMQAVEAIKQSSQAFRKVIYDTENTVCGRHTIYTALRIFDGRYAAEQVSYTRSSVLRDYGDSSVSYVGIVGK